MRVEYFKLVSACVGVPVRELEENWLLEETLTERANQWEFSGKDEFYIDMGAEDAYSMM